MPTDPRTGITTYAAQNTPDTADATAPSTATDLSYLFAPATPAPAKAAMPQFWNDPRVGSQMPLASAIELGLVPNPGDANQLMNGGMLGFNPFTGGWDPMQGRFDDSGAGGYFFPDGYFDQYGGGFNPGTGHVIKGPESPFANHQLYGSATGEAGTYEPIFGDQYGRSWLYSDPTRPDFAKASEYSISNNTLFDNMMNAAVMALIAYSTGGLAAPYVGPTAAAAAGGAAAGGASTGTLQGALKGAAAGAAGGAMAGEAGGATSGEFGGLSDPELADILAGGSGDLSALGMGGVTPEMIASASPSVLDQVSQITGIPTGVLQSIGKFGTAFATNGGNAKDALLSAGINAGANAAAGAITSPSSVMDSFNPDVQYADTGVDLKRPGMMSLSPNASPVPGADVFDLAGTGQPMDLSGAATASMPFQPFQVADAGDVLASGTASDVLGSGNYNAVYAQPAVSGINLDGTPVAPNASPVPQQSTGNALLDQALGIQNGSLVNYEDPALKALMGTSGMLPSPSSDQEQHPQQPDQQQAAKQQQVASMLERVGKLGAALAKMHEGRGTPEDAPQRQDGQSDADYAQSLVQYANLDPQTLAAQGLTPGTPEYYQYVMDQMDSVINQLTSGLDVDGKDLIGRLHSKTRDELTQLERALYVRGQLNQLMGSGTYTDPFTGIGEKVIAPDGQRINPGRAAYQRGLARSVDEMARMAPEEALRYAGGMLDRNPDLYGMQASADARQIQEQLANQSFFDDLKRRKGMLGQGDVYGTALSQLDPASLRAILSRASDPQAALAALLGK